MISKLPAFASRATRRLLHHSAVSRGAAATAAAQPHWSGSLSHATPEADFTALHVSANSATMESEWSQQLSFVSPESDFTAPNVKNAPAQAEWSKDFSFASPESDFTALYVSANSATMESEWSQQLSFASPESDFSAQTVGDDRINNVVAENREGLLNLQVSANSATVESEWAQQILMADAQQDVARLQAQLEPDEWQLDSHAMDLMAQQMLLSCPESATGFVHAAETLSLPLKAQLAAIATPLPTTLEEALQSDDDRRAIVVTTATSPFRVVHVNKSWEGLCGYTQAEAENVPIGHLLKGPETVAPRDMVQHLKEHPETPQATVLVNYTKSGRRFRNRLSVGPLYSKEDSGKAIQYLVGVLQEVNVDEQEEGLQMAA